MQQYFNAGGSCEFVSVTAQGQRAAIILIASEGCARVSSSGDGAEMQSESAKRYIHSKLPVD